MRAGLLTTVNAFGYTVSFVIILVVIALVLALLLAVQLYLTIGLSVYRSVKNNRRDRARERIEDEMLGRLFGEDLEWEAWVSGLSSVERETAETLLDEYLRELDGSDAARLRELGEVLGIPTRAGRTLTSGNSYERLDALTWLTLLRRPDIVRESAFEPRTTRERSSVTRLRLESEQDPAYNELLGLLLDGVERPFSVFGQDTLYRVACEDPETLLDIATDEYQNWSEPLHIQVLQVTARLDTSVRRGDMAWVTASLEDEQEGVRVAAAQALGNFGWDPGLRERVFFKRAVSDPSPRARGAVYEMLGEWGDDQAIGVLLFGLVSEDDPRAMVRGMDALLRRRDRVDERTPEIFGDAWDWSREHGRYDDMARRKVRVLS